MKEDDNNNDENNNKDTKNSIEMTPHIVTAAPVSDFCENKISDFLEMGANVTDETVTTPGGTVIRRRRVQI